MESADEFTGPETQERTFVALGKKSKRAPTMDVPSDEVVNLISLYDEEKEAKPLGQRVWDLYVKDAKSCAPRMSKIREFIEAYASIMRAKSFPWQNAANINLPILTYPMLQVCAREYDMIWPENGKVINSAPASIEDMPRADATEVFSNSYIRTEMPEMEQGMDDTISQKNLAGSAFRRTLWDVYENRLRSDWIPIEDFVVAMNHRSQDPSMRDVPRYTLVHHYTIADLEAFGADGIFENTEGLAAGDQGDAPANDLTDTKSKLDGTAKQDDDDPDKPRMVLEQHCRIRLPDRTKDHPSFDGQYHYVIVTIDEPTKRVLRLVLREENDPKDVKRYEREKATFDQYMASVTAPVAPGGTVLLPKPPFGKDKAGNAKEPSLPKKRQIPFFTHYRAFWSEGFYGLGFGDFLLPLVKAANSLLNQHIDGVTIRNARPGFISRQLRGPRGSISVNPGKLEEVDAPAEVVKNGVVWLDPPLNDPTTMPLVKMVLDIGEKLAGSADLMSGATSGSNRTAKEIQVLNAQLMKQITVLARRTKAAFKHELDKMWRCWGVFLPETPEVRQVVDPATGQPQQVTISRSMFLPDARVTPAADPRMRFERIEEAQQRFGFVMNNPMLAQNPMALYEATADVMQSIGGEKIMSVVQKPQPPQPPQPQEHWQEEAGWLEDKDPPVHPADNDDKHGAMHMAFLTSPASQKMSPDQRKRAEQHVRNHDAQALKKRFTAAPPQMPPDGMPRPMQPPQIMGGM